jgi:hypothetical protein
MTQFKVGQKWRTRGNDIREIEEIRVDIMYPGDNGLYLDDETHRYLDGSYYADGIYYEDLVTLIEDVPQDAETEDFNPATMDNDTIYIGTRKYVAADRIEELEEKLLSATMDGYDMAKHEYRDRIEELEVKLAIADRLAEVLNDILQNRGHCFIPNRIAGREDWDEDATEALKDFKGEKE